MELSAEIVKLFAIPVLMPKGTLCCPECKSTDLEVAIYTYWQRSVNKCYHYWEI